MRVGHESLSTIR